MASMMLAGPHIKVYFGGNCLKELQSISYTINRNEEPIYGIDSVFPQEIVVNRVSVTGSGVIYCIQNQFGLQETDITSRIHEIMYAPYVSLRIVDRKNDKNIFFCPQVKITQESMSISAKGTIKIHFSFIGIVPYLAGDLN